MAKMQIEINADGTDVAIAITATGAPAFGWAAAWDQISGNIKKSLEMRENKAQDKTDAALAALADLIGKIVQETQRLCKATGKDLPFAMLDVMAWGMKKKVLSK